MASTDVIRGHARLRLSIKQLFSFKYGGDLTSLDRCHGYPRAPSSIKSLNGLHPRPVSAGQERWLGAPSGMRPTSLPMMAGAEPEVGSEAKAVALRERWLEASSQSPVMAGEEPDRMSAASAMASKKSPATLTRSGVYVGGGRSGEDIDLSSFSSPHQSNMKYERDCMKELSALSIADDCSQKELSSLSVADDSNHKALSTLSISDKSQEKSPTLSKTEENQEQPNLNSVSSKLLETLRKFGVQSRPVRYQEKIFRAESTEIFCKNLFLKDRRGQIYMVICDEIQDINFKTLRRKLKAYRNFSFVPPEEMAAILQVHPGGVTPFALMHGTARDVRVAITTDLTTDPEALLNFHPLDHLLTLPVKLDQLKQFLALFRFELEYLDMES